MGRVYLVGQIPDAVKRDVILTDGTDHYRVMDSHYRSGSMWFELLNITSPELEARAWFRLEDIEELAFDKTPGPARRRYGVRRQEK